MERLDVIIDGVELSFLKSGEARTVYVHGAGCDATVWENQLRGVGGCAIDLPNHGSSGEAEIRSLEDYAYFVARFVERQFGKASIVGHSMGGAVAQLLCEYGVVEKLVLVATGARLRVRPEILKELEERGEEAARVFLRYAFSDEPLAEKYVPVLAKNHKVLLKDLRLCDAFDLLERYESGEFRIDVPTLVVAGSKDVLTPVRYSEFLRDHIPDSRLVVIDAGHMVMLEKPEELNLELRRFL
ncbi:MAG: alpha/beta hydrolase [Archaeoglobaceae archaeon]